MAIDNDVLDQLLTGRDPGELFAKDGLLDELKKALLGADAGRRAGRPPGERRRRGRNGPAQRLIEEDDADGRVETPGLV